ncbi:hypothetical protein F0562_004274 [Nyssa sinensis]|uniref:Uncharacterized protein n=1 Tax=Nyssa sinensis TaxID=561372 RepID=A0A5J5BXN7_9ASTE|nr:hypothetical protein F0562_004274 [Nyssa sinensis]
MDIEEADCVDVILLDIEEAGCGVGYMEVILVDILVGIGEAGCVYVILLGIGEAGCGVGWLLFSLLEIEGIV